MDEAWSLDNAGRLRARVREIRKADYKEWNWTELAVWARREQKLGAGRIDHLLRQLKFMSRHEHAPVKLVGRSHAIVESACDYVVFRHEQEGKAASALDNDYAAIRLLFGFLNLNADALPKPPKAKPKLRPLLEPPEEVHRLLSWNFGETSKRRSYENALVRYLLGFGFGFGVRPPSELWRLQLDTFDPDRHYLVVIRDKQDGKPQRLRILPEYLCCGRTNLSITNYLKWRDKVAERTEGSLFVKEDGRPFPTKEALGAFLWKRVPREEFPWFSLYTMRHWCATARLIDTEFDYEYVSWWMSHSPDELRETYDRDARVALDEHGPNWLYRAFHGQPRRITEEHEGPLPKGSLGRQRRNRKAEKGVLRQSPSGDGYGLGGIPSSSRGKVSQQKRGTPQSCDTATEDAGAEGPGFSSFLRAAIATLTSLTARALPS